MFLRQSYINTSIAFIDQDIAKLTFDIKTEFMSGSHTEVKIRNVLSETFSEHKMDKKNVFAVSDNGSNVIKGLSDLGVNRNTFQYYGSARYMIC